ncbi:MAG: B12-binding domain-containing radical SAM protein [Actinobacteria bacterium]|nr:B12-binding domain-containing radical SAM protein [Actinomycetota bacterium]
MNVLFIHAEEDHYSREKPLTGYEHMQFGISYISSLLKEEGHETRLVVPTRESDAEVFEHIEDFNPGLICFTSVYSVFDLMSEVAGRVKERHPDIFLAVGGPHASLAPHECLESAFDAVCVGEGEFPTLELAEQLESGLFPRGIPNLFIKENGRVEENPTRPFLEDVEALPFPDREMWLPWLANPLSRPSVLAGRGCPFQCTYCCNHALRRLADGKYVRLREPENIAEEILSIKRVYYLLEEMYLEVETLGADLDWALELCSLLEDINRQYEVPIAYGTNLRVTPRTDYDKLFAALERSNFDFVNIGLESGSERVRREILKRRYSNDDVIRAVEAARKHGIKVGFYNLIGLPGETKEDFRETIRMNRVCKPDWYLLSAFFPYPGTELHKTSVELGLLDRPLDRKLERRRPVLDQKGFTKRQVKRRLTWSPLLFGAGIKPAWEVVRRLFLGKIFASPRLLRYWRNLRTWLNPYKKLGF